MQRNFNSGGTNNVNTKKRMPFMLIEQWDDITFDSLMFCT